MPECARLACAIAMCDVAPPRPSRSISVRMLKIKTTYMMIMIRGFDIDKKRLYLQNYRDRQNRRGCLLCYRQAEPGRELTQPSPRLLAEPCEYSHIMLIMRIERNLESNLDVDKRGGF